MSEATDWSVRGSVQSKYRAMSCRIAQLDPDEAEFDVVSDRLTNSQIG